MSRHSNSSMASSSSTLASFGFAKLRQHIATREVVGSKKEKTQLPEMVREKETKEMFNHCFFSF